MEQEMLQKVIGKLDEEIEIWGSPKLVRAWWILHTPSFKNGEPFLDRNDIEQLSELMIELSEEIRTLKTKQEPKDETETH